MPYINKTQQTGGQRDASSPFPKKGDLRIAKNYWGITLTSIAAKISNALRRNREDTWEDTYEEPKWLSDKSIHDLTNFWLSIEF